MVCIVPVHSDHTVAQFRDNLLPVALILGEFSVWSGPEVSKWVGLVVDDVGSSDRTLDETRAIYKGHHKLWMGGIGSKEGVVLAIAVEAVDTAEAEAGPQWPQDAPKKHEPIEVAELQTKVVERNEVYHKISYIVTLKNNTLETKQGVGVTINFLDADGFILDDTPKYLDTLPPGETKVRGYALVDTALAIRIATIKAKID